MYIIGAKDIIEKILPVVDNFERGLAQATEGDPFAEGMEKNLQTAHHHTGESGSRADRKLLIKN